MSPEPALTTNSNTDDSIVVDLPAVIPPVRALLAFYDALLAGSDPPIDQLDVAVARIRSLPAIPGRLGRDILLIVNGGETAERTEIIGALERLRQLAAMEPEPVPAPPEAKGSRPRRPRSKASNRLSQDTLPGMSP